MRSANHVPYCDAPGTAGSPSAEGQAECGEECAGVGGSSSGDDGQVVSHRHRFIDYQPPLSARQGTDSAGKAGIRRSGGSGLSER